MAKFSKCRWCGLSHGVQCPSVKAIEYFADGKIKRVEFKGAADYCIPQLPYVPLPYYTPQVPYCPPYVPGPTWITCDSHSDLVTSTMIGLGPN